ncbi:MAG TPA: hypothetical protein VFN35_26970 [Ktedonobacteraceae bacterium]|nr:hypothetical protein [Ktedonobacteraceae bacterium]
MSKQIHLDEQACSVHLLSRATFSPWGLHAHLLMSRVAIRNSVVGGGRAGTPSSPYFSPHLKIYPNWLFFSFVLTLLARTD